MRPPRDPGQHNPAMHRRHLALIVEAEGRLRRQHRSSWPGLIAAEERRLLSIGADRWTAAHVAWCLRERMLEKERACATATGPRGDRHECVLAATHTTPHRCACGHAWGAPLEGGTRWQQPPTSRSTTG